MSTAELTQSMLALPVAQRIAIADQLYASVPEQYQAEADAAWLKEAASRSEEMEGDPSCEISYEEFKKGLRRSTTNA